jgi:hypothetical protein
MMPEFLLLASGLVATTYGYNELMCGDVGKPVPCALGAITASGVPFDPSLPQVALAAPSNIRIRATWIYIKAEGQQCKKVHLVDKMNERWIGVRGMDLTPAAVELITGKPASETWSGKVFVCDSRELRVQSSKWGNKARKRKVSHEPDYFSYSQHLPPILLP